MEGLSISLLEAMSYGKACIVNDYGLPFTSDEVYTMRNNKPDTIAEAIRYFINNSNQIQSFGDHAKRRIKKDYSVESFSLKHIDLYDNLANA